jgi:salicylate hydroxylase
MQIRRWQDGKILAVQPLMDMAGYIGHRGDYHDSFLRAVRKAGIEIKMGSEVASFNEDKPSITLADGTEVVADLIVGADGIKSKTRELVLGFTDAPKSSGYSCYRSYFPGDILLGDERCKDFVSHDSVNIWIGPDVHLIQNSLRGGKEVNIIMTRKLSEEEDKEITESWFEDGDVNDVLALTTDIDPWIRAVIEKIPGPPCLLDWKICYRDPLPTWVSKSHKIALLGDSCHPHLPTSAQGASQATESAAVLAVCLKLAGKDNIPLAVSECRVPRAG